jgi:hypothetical protein
MTNASPESTQTNSAARVIPWIARLLVIAGAVSLTYGASLAWRPAGFIVGGALLLVTGIGALR